MSAVLHAPVSHYVPGINDFLDIFTRPEFQNALKGFIITLIEEDQDFRESLRVFFDYSTATSDLCVLKRLSVLETDLEHNDLDFGDEDRKPTIPEQIKQLAEKIDSPQEKSIEVIENEVDIIIPHTTLEHKACALVEHLKTKVEPRNNGEIFLNSREVTHFLKHEILDKYKMKDIKNPRQAKKDVIDKVKKMFPTNIILDPKKHGRKEVRIIYRPSVPIHTVPK